MAVYITRTMGGRITVATSITRSIPRSPITSRTTGDAVVGAKGDAGEVVDGDGRTMMTMTGRWNVLILTVPVIRRRRAVAVDVDLERNRVDQRGSTTLAGVPWRSRRRDKGKVAATGGRIKRGRRPSHKRRYGLPRERVYANRHPVPLPVVGVIVEEGGEETLDRNKSGSQKKSNDGELP